MNLLSLISQWKALSATVPTCANDGLISIIRFVSQFPDGFCNLFFISIWNPSQHPPAHPIWHPKIFISRTKRSPGILPILIHARSDIIADLLFREQLQFYMLAATNLLCWMHLFQREVQDRITYGARFVGRKMVSHGKLLLGSVESYGSNMVPAHLKPVRLNCASLYSNIPQLMNLDVYTICCRRKLIVSYMMPLLEDKQSFEGAVMSHLGWGASSPVHWLTSESTIH
jgi:hypothetical protein